MTTRDAEPRYHAGMIVIHWLQAGLILCAAVSALLIDEMPNKDLKALMTNGHFVIGATVLFLTLLRLLLRVSTASPALPDSTHPHLARAAHLGQFGLYVLMLAVPVIGVITAFYRGRGIDFGLFQISPLWEANRATGRFFKEIHEVLAYLFFAGICGHALFALWHHYRLKDGLLDRMRLARRPVL